MLKNVHLLCCRCGFCAQHTKKYASLEALLRLASGASCFAVQNCVFEDIMRSKATLLRKLLKKGTVVTPGCFNAASAMLIEKCGFGAAYISGAGLSNSAGLPDTGLLSMSEVAKQAGNIAKAVNIPVIADIDTGNYRYVNSF